MITCQKQKKDGSWTPVTAAIIEATGIDAVDLVDLERVAPDLGYDIMAKVVLLVGD